MYDGDLSVGINKALFIKLVCIMIKILLGKDAPAHQSSREKVINVFGLEEKDENFAYYFAIFSPLFFNKKKKLWSLKNVLM